MLWYLVGYTIERSIEFYIKLYGTFYVMFHKNSKFYDIKQLQNRFNTLQQLGV